jgi:hypothetical protein
MEENEKIKILDNPIFKDKKVNDLLQEIYTSIKDEHDDIKDLMKDITDLIDKDTDEGMLGFIGPVLKDLLDVSVKNNEQYIKLAGTIQRFLSLDYKNAQNKGTSINDEDFISLTEEEKNQLKDIKKANQLIDLKRNEIKNNLSLLKAE